MAIATPTVISATTIKVIDFSIKFGLTTLNYVVLETSTPHSNSDPPPAFVITSTETMAFSMAFGLAALIYISPESFREFYVDFVDIHCEIRVFT
jgi:hypothetical protein